MSLYDYFINDLNFRPMWNFLFTKGFLEDGEAGNWSLKFRIEKRNEAARSVD